eukprot:6173487-Pleurochrysis_carterae.AAC.1
MKLSSFLANHKIAEFCNIQQRCFPKHHHRCKVITADLFNLARWLERRLERPSRASRLHALTSEIRLLLSEPARLTGIAFVTFNEQRAAFACLHELGSTPLRSDEDAIPLLLSARFAEDPDR